MGTIAEPGKWTDGQRGEHGEGGMKALCGTISTALLQLRDLRAKPAPVGRVSVSHSWGVMRTEVWGDFPGQLAQWGGCPHCSAPACLKFQQEGSISKSRLVTLGWKAGLRLAKLPGDGVLLPS